jgi:hypothetical protein
MRIVVPKRWEITEGYGKLHSVELQYPFLSPKHF